METMQETRKVTREVEVRLTQTELADYGKQAGAVSAELAEAVAEFDSVKKEHKGKIGAVEANLDDILKKLKAGKEVRMVECEETKDYQSNTVKVVFDGETVEERAMTGEERQAEMFVKEPEVLDAEESVDPKQDLTDVMSEETSHSKVGLLEAPNG